MKYIYTTLFALLITTMSMGQIVWESNFDSWSAGDPSDWMGTKTNLLSDSAVQVTSGAMFGDNLVEVTNNEGPHRRFTTEGISLTEGQVYEVEVWVKGEGEIRTGLWDNDMDGFDFGYNTYGVWVDVTGSDLTNFVQTISPDTTYSACELILSVIGGALEIDRVEVRIGQAAEPEPKTIAEIQTTTDPDGDSPELGVYVVTSGTVTAVAEFGYWMQDGQGAWSGIYVNDSDNAVAVGDQITVTGYVTEFFNQTQIGTLGAFEMTGAGAVPAAEVMTTGAISVEMWEGVLVNTSGNCIIDIDNFNEWAIDDGSGQVFVNDFMYMVDPSPTWMYDVTGVLGYSFGNFKIEPRDINDVDETLGLEDLEVLNITMYPNPAAEYFTIERQSTAAAQVRMYDASSRLVMDTIITDQIQTIDLSGLATGQYTVIFTEGDTNAGTQLQIVK